MNEAENVKFPQYRKYKNNKHFFKILSATEFEEISFIGQKLILTKHVAKIYPDKTFIMDLLFDSENTADLSSEREYQEQLKSL